MTEAKPGTTCPQCHQRNCQGHEGRHGIRIYWSMAIGRFVTLPEDDA